MKVGHVNKKWIVAPKHPWTERAFVLVLLVTEIPKKKTEDGSVFWAKKLKNSKFSTKTVFF